MSIVRIITPKEIADNARGSAKPAPAAFWDAHARFVERLNVDGEFWADVVARLKRERRHAEAAAVCRVQRPLPAAYRDLMICLRAMLKSGGDRSVLLPELYAAAIEATVLHRVPYIEFEVCGRMTGRPGFNAASIMWERLSADPIPIEYPRVGCNHVEWLNQTDRIRLAEHWGEPAMHADPFELFTDSWRAAVHEVQAQEQRQSDEFRESLSKILTGPVQDALEPPKRRGLLRRLLG